ncbi:MAG TPA: glycosyltransferase family 2 protein [Candidatus Microsaccharimonas sp.]|nr:glycosyltransferase family 2 protein [Candidatus Microsaccharimonas sp.]
MHKHLRISLVIPAYNEEANLADCLEAALAQTVPFYEIIVVDNASTDATAQVAARYRGVRVVHESRRGIAHARNAGFNAARGDYIARIDADTQLPIGWAAHIEAFYTDPINTQTAWTGSGAFMGVPLARLVNFTYRTLAFHSNRLLIGHPTIWGSNMAFPAAMWQKVGRHTCVQRGIHEDLDLAIHAVQADMTVYFDKTMPVPARLRRIEGSRAQLWDYLQWWPRTLKQHGYASWRICWLIGVLPLYLATPVLNLGSALKRGTAQVLSAFEV